MHIGILSARSPRYHPNRRLIEAGSRLGHKVSLLHPKNCLSEVALGKVDLHLPTNFANLEVLLPRIGATINEYALALVRHFELRGVPVINGFHPILLARNKFLTLQSLADNGIRVPDSNYVSNFKSLEKAITRLGGYPVVVKMLKGRQGKGVILVESSRTSEFIMDNLLSKGEGLLVQEFISPCARRDIRAFVLGTQVIAAMELSPKEGDFRANIHLKGKARPVRLDKELATLAVKSTKVLGLEISGTDIIVEAHGEAKVIEVNYSPGFRGLEASTGLDIASQIIQYVTRI